MMHLKHILDALPQRPISNKAPKLKNRYNRLSRQVLVESSELGYFQPAVML
jgi:hypothetical protein